MNYPENVKDIKNLNEFIRKAKEIETDKFWQDQLSECTLAKDDSWWTRKESPLKWKRHIIQQYLDYKNKVEESLNTKLVDMNKLPYIQQELESRSESEYYKKILDKYNTSKSKRIKLTYSELDDISAIYSDRDDYKDIEKIIYGSNLNESAAIDWNNYLTPEEVKKFLSKDDKNESAEQIIYSKEFEPRYKDLHNPLQAKYKNSWTKKELVNDLANFYYQGNLITESNSNKITLYHNTTNDNAIKINKEGIIPGLRKDVYGEGSEGEATGIWCSTKRGYGYGGATITFEVDSNDKDLVKENDTEYMLYRKVDLKDIIDIDLMISNIPSNPNRKDSINSTVESDIPYAVEHWGKDEVLKILGKENRLAKPYTKEQLEHLINTGEKYCKGVIKLTENNDYLKRQEIFNNIKSFNPNANWDNYKDRSINQMLAIWQSYQNKANRKKSDIENRKDKIDEIDKEEYIEIPETTLDIDYDYETDESIASKLDLEKGLEYEKELNENKVKGIPSKYQFMVKDIYKGGDGYWNIDLADGFENNDGTNYIWDKTKKGCLEILDSLYQDYKKSNKVTESIHKLEEKSRNELLAKTKSQTVTRYNKAEGYKGFYIYDIDTTNIFNKNSNLLITCKVGDYHSQVEIENTLWWVEYEVDERGHDTQITTKYVTQALMDAIDGMNIKVNCECGDFVYRMKYQATKYGYNYGRPENRPAKITNPNDIGALCKHLTAMLSNKKWLQQVTSTLMDYIVKNIDKVNQFLNRKPGQELTVPDEAQRRLGKQAAYSKVLSRQEILQNVADDFIKEAGDKVFTQNINLDDDLRRFINNSDDYSWQKIQPNEFRVIKGYIDNYIKNNSKDVNN